MTTIDEYKSVSKEDFHKIDIRIEQLNTELRGEIKDVELRLSNKIMIYFLIQTLIIIGSVLAILKFGLNK